MTGPREHHQGSKPAREIFLTSSSLSFFSSLSSSSRDSSEEDAIEINMETTPTSSFDEDQKGKLLKASSRGSEMSCLTHVTMQPAPSPPSKYRPGSPYDPERIPASVFGKKGKDLNWSDESLFSLRMSNFDAFRQSNFNPEDLLMPGEFLAYSPSLKVKSEDVAEEEITHVVKEKKTSVETNDIHGEKKSLTSSPPPPVYSYPSSFAQLYQVQPTTKAQSISIPVSEKKSKKKRKKNKKEKKNTNKCCCSMCSWLFSGFSKCRFYLCCCCCK